MTSTSSVLLIVRLTWICVWFGFVEVGFCLGEGLGRLYF